MARFTGWLLPACDFIEAQMHTLRCRSYGPENQAAMIRPSAISTSVDAWHCLNGGLSKIISLATTVIFNDCMPPRAKAPEARNSIAMGKKACADISFYFIFLWVAAGHLWQRQIWPKVENTRHERLRVKIFNVRITAKFIRIQRTGTKNGKPKRFNRKFGRKAC